MSVSVIIPTYKNPTCLDWCLKSATENQYGDNEIIVVVDGYIEESQDVLDKYTGLISVLDLGQNCGMPSAINYGCWSASNELILVVNDDNVFPHNWDVILEHDAVDDMMVLSPNQIEANPSIFNFLVKDFGNPDTFDYAGYKLWEVDNRSNPMTRNGCIFPFLMQKKWYMAVGGFNTIYQSPFVVDWDFFVKLEMIGLHFGRINKLAFYHFGGQATKNRTDGEEVGFKQSEHDAMATYEYMWGHSPLRHPQTNSHKPSGKIKGIDWDSI